MSAERMREDFERWITTTGLEADLSRGNHGCYLNPPTHWLYCAWVASRASVEVELPDWFDPYGGSGEQAYWRIEVDRAIESAGLKIKP